MTPVSFDQINHSKTLFNKLSKILEDIFDQGEAQSIAFLIIEKLFGLSRVKVIANYPVIINDSNSLELLLKRIGNNEPIQYIMGETEFFDLTFKVNPSVLIPRPETEELVNLIIRENKKASQLTLLDIGTGSGCIAISLVKNIPQAKVFAMDIDKETIKTAQENALLNKVNVFFLHGDILKDGILNDIPTLDLIVSNPPYVRELEKLEMKENVLKHEPEKALFVQNANPLQFYEKITKIASEKLRIGGRLYFEINEAYGLETKSLLVNNGFKNVEKFHVC
ncbi:MAG: peptide chain release factor N(5)-glutamine methyltransferase, partial [Flammeovirgaceae bacterium]|nr:peptide chain release factor N(5)-glutamine methyltransferase [Flammeovirgaceae bacterium]